MYEVIVKQACEPTPRNAHRVQEETAYDQFTRKSDVIRFIAEEVGATQTSFANEVGAQSDSQVKRDSQGWRAEIYFS